MRRIPCICVFTTILLSGLFFPTYAAKPFTIGDIRLLPSRFRDNYQRDSAWLMSLSSSQFLRNFRQTAGILRDGSEKDSTFRALGGWESEKCELRGHITGHALSALAYMYASTGKTCFKERADEIVDGLKQAQDAYGTGYLSAYPEEQIDRNIRGEHVWAPWYTLHKIMAGLLDQYSIAGNEKALEIVKDMANWAYGRLVPLDSLTRTIMLRNEFGGTPEAFWNLYEITGREKDRWLAEFFYHNEVIDPLRAGNPDFEGKHTNTYIPKVLGEARNYEITRNPDAFRATKFFWNQMLSSQTFCTGSLSDREHFIKPEEFSKHITGYTGETCCTYNMLKLTAHIFEWTQDEMAAEYYERALINHIFGGQDPDSRMISYFLPLATGSHKVYSTALDSFWCCVGSSFECHARYSENIYFEEGDTVFVNLLIPSELNWKKKGLKIRLESKFPEEETASIRITEGKSQAIFALRYPTWSGVPEIKVNGHKVKIGVSSGEYILIKRKWTVGDEITVKYPMSLHIEYANDSDKKGALMYGPIVLAGRLGAEGFAAPQPFSNPLLNNDYYTYDYRIPEGLPTSVDLTKLIKNGHGPHFITADGIHVDPLYDIHRERYVVYWDLN